MSNKPPVARVKDGSLSLAIFEDASKDGKVRFSSPGVVRSYFDEKSQAWKETHSLSGSEYLRAAIMLQDAYRQELELKAAARAAANRSAPEASNG